jgi:hypothetical protein
VLLAKIQEKKHNQNVQFIRVEQRPLDPTMNVVTRSGAVTGGHPTKPSGTWVRKAEEKNPATDLNKFKETFVHTSREFCILNPPSEKGKGPEIEGTSTRLRSDWKESTISTACQENEPASNIKSFLQSCLKLILDENAQLEVQRPTDYCDPTNIPTATERAVNHIQRYVLIGQEM